MNAETKRVQGWLGRVALDVNTLRKKPRLSREKKLQAIRQSYDILHVLVKVAKGQARIDGAEPPPHAQ